MAKASATAVGGDLIHTRTTAGTEESGVAVIGEDGTDNVLGPLVQVGSSRAMPTAGVSYANATGTITTAASTVTLSNIGAAGNVTIYIYGTYAGVNVTFEISPDNTNWFPVSATREDSAVSESSTGVLPSNTSRAWTMGAPGFSFVRVRATAWTSGTANVVLVAGTYPFEPLVAAVLNGSLPAGSNAIGTVTAAQATPGNLQATVTQQALTKGSQGANGVTTQDLKDAGRQPVMLAWVDVAGTANAESALTNFSVGTRNASALTAASSYTVSSGKTLRIQSIVYYLRSTGTAFLQSYFRLRQAASGISNSSPVILSLALNWETATVASGTGIEQVLPIPDGLEIAAGQQITFTWLTTANTCVVGFTLLGYEY